MVALNKEKMMKLISRLEKDYAGIAPSIFKIRENFFILNFNFDNFINS